MTDRLDSTTLVQRLALLAVVRLSEAGETPAHAGEIARVCAEAATAVDGDVVGTVSEADVTRALNQLDDDDHLRRVEADEQSPVGKGRPAYELTYATTTLIETLGDDDRLRTVVEQLADDVS